MQGVDKFEKLVTRVINIRYSSASPLRTLLGHEIQTCFVKSLRLVEGGRVAEAKLRLSLFYGFSPNFLATPRV